jgi:hypothetical protein
MMIRLVIHFIHGRGRGESYFFLSFNQHLINNNNNTCYISVSLVSLVSLNRASHVRARAEV